MCSKRECLMQRKSIMKNTDVKVALQYLEKCEACCFKQLNKSQYELETYNEACKSYVRTFWKKH